jgi:hypothetical protein
LAQIWHRLVTVQSPHPILYPIPYPIPLFADYFYTDNSTILSEVSDENFWPRIDYGTISKENLRKIQFFFRFSTSLLLAGSRQNFTILHIFVRQNCENQRSELADLINICTYEPNSNCILLQIADKQGVCLVQITIDVSFGLVILFLLNFQILPKI